VKPICNGGAAMSFKIAPLRLHVAMLNSLRAIAMLGCGKLSVSQIQGQYSRGLAITRTSPSSQTLKDHFQSLSEMYSISWKAKGRFEWLTIEDILKGLEDDGCPDAFLESITIERPWIKSNAYTLQDEEIHVPFMFRPHPFKPSVFHRLKSELPSYRLYSKMKEMRAKLSTDLDEQTKKRWRDILLVNIPHPTLENQEIRHLWANVSCCILLKESKGKFMLMEVEELRGVGV
jgi:hypothetical protein